MGNSNVDLQRCQQLVVSSGNDVCMSLPGVPCGYVQTVARGRLRVWFLQDLEDRVGPSADIADRTVGDCILPYLPKHGDIAGDHRRSASERLDDG